MERIPAKYRNIYTDRDLFTPYRDEEGCWVYQVIVELTPGLWDHGAMMRYEFFSKSSEEEKSLAHATVHDHSVSQEYVVPMFMALAVGDARGALEMNFAHDIYFYFATENQGFRTCLAKHLPLVKDFYDKTMKDSRDGRKEIP